MDRLKVKIDPFPFEIKHGDSVLLLGSCFSEEIHTQLRKHGFDSVSNPFGTVFHPVPLSRFLRETIQGTAEERIHCREDVFLSWDASSAIYSLSEQDLNNKISLIRSEWKTRLASADHIFITLGTAWGYRLKEQELIVANCHRRPLNYFEKILGKVQELTESLIEAYHAIRSVNEHVNIIITVSPVRHSRDGIIENTRSKAVLHLVIQEILDLPHFYYFPSYEILIDELRDYRYFAGDFVHPNELAINYLWDRFKDVSMDHETKQLSTRVASLRRQSEHRFIHPESEESNHFRLKTSADIAQLLHEHPEIVW